MNIFDADADAEAKRRLRADLLSEAAVKMVELKEENRLLRQENAILGARLRILELKLNRLRE